MWLDAKYLNPFFTRRLTQEVKMERMLNSHHHGCCVSASLFVFVSWCADLCLTGSFTRSNPDEISDQQVVWRGPTGALGLRGRRGWNRTPVNTFSSHESEGPVWICWFLSHMKGRVIETQSDHARISSSYHAFKACRPGSTGLKFKSTGMCEEGFGLKSNINAPCLVVFLFHFWLLNDTMITVYLNVSLWVGLLQMAQKMDFSIFWQNNSKLSSHVGRQLRQPVITVCLGQIYRKEAHGR